MRKPPRRGRLTPNLIHWYIAYSRVREPNAGGVNCNAENRDKVIVFIGNDYGIFDTHEFLVLTGVPIQCLPPHLSSPEEILIRYGCAQPRPGARLMEDSD